MSVPSPDPPLPWRSGKNVSTVQQRLTLLLNHEIAAVETAMRSPSKWAVVPRYYEEDRNEPGKYDDAFRTLRAEIFTHSDWSKVDPMVYLTPFLTLIKASDVSGPVTGAAAVALQRILGSELMSLNTHNVGAAINQIVEDATLSKFESTNNAQDEIVLLNIVEVLGLAVQCETGVLLTDVQVNKAFQAAFMLGDPVTKPKEYGDIMAYYSRQTCGQMLRTVFGRLRNQVSGRHAKGDKGVVCQHGINGAVEIMDFLIDLIRKEQAIGKVDNHQDQIWEDQIMFTLDMVHTALLTLGPELMHFDVLVTQVHVGLMHAICQAVVNNASVSIINAFSQILLCIYSFIGTISICQIEVVLERVMLKMADGKGVVTAEQQEAALEGILDLCRQPGFVHDVFVNCDCRLERGNLFEDMCTLMSKTAYPVSKGSTGPSHFICQEALLAILQAIAAENKANAFMPPSPELDLPCFIDVWSPLVQGDLLHLKPLMDAADASTGTNAQVAGASTASRTSGSAAATVEALQDVADACAAARSNGGIESAAEHAAAERRVSQPSVPHAAQAPQHGSPPGASQQQQQQQQQQGPACTGADGQLSDFCRLRSAVYEKHMKQKLAVAVEHFNKDHKKGLQFLQATRLMPLLEGSPAAKAAIEAGTHTSPHDIVSEDELAACLGRFLRVCPGLDKDAIGELLGEPAPFYIKILEAYTHSFDFRDSSMTFVAGIRLYLESFRLPGEAQKIDRIINAFGRHYFSANQSQNIFKSADAAYVLAYSVIMLNTDQHNKQVKNRMTVESFRRNLRGVNDKANFPDDFLGEIFYSIVNEPLKLETASSMDVSEQVFMNLHQISRTARGQMIHSDPGRHLFDTTMFRLMWGPAVHAMCSIVDNVASESMLESALRGLQTAAHIAMCHQLEDVADSIVINLSKIPGQIMNVTGSRPDVVFGRDAKMLAVTRTLSSIANKHGDCLQAGWTNVVDLIVCFYRLQMLPDSFAKALDGDGEGGLNVSPGEASPGLKTRRMLAKAQSAAGTSIYRSISYILALPGPEPDLQERQLTEADRELAGITEKALSSCCFEDIFTDSKFLKQDSLVHLVKAIIWASGPIPRPSGNNTNNNWDVAELCLELLFTVLLRNRDRISMLWPRTYEHFHAIFSSSKDVDPALVQKAIMAMLRLCQRLLPYKTDISEPLMRGIQLVSLVDEQVASDMASTIAAEVLNLLKGAAPYIQHQPVWVSICGLLKIIQYDPASFPVCVETMTCVVKESLTPLNFTIVLPTVVDLLERAVPDMRRGERPGYPQHIPELLSLLLSSEEWLELWWLGMSRGPRAGEPQWQAFKHDAWYQVVSMLCRVIKNPNLEVRSTAVGYLQRSVVAAEKLGIAVAHVQQSLMMLVLPMTNDLSRNVAAGAKDFAQCDVTVRELIRAVVKIVLLFSEALQELPTFGTAWRAILECLGSAMAGGSAKSELLTEAIPEALKNMLLVLQSGKLKEGWQDSDGTDLSELTWRVAKKISVNLTKEVLHS